MAKRIYAFVMDDSMRAEADRGNYAIVASYLKFRSSAMVITDEQIEEIARSGDPDMAGRFNGALFGAIVRDLDSRHR